MSHPTPFGEGAQQPENPEHQPHPGQPPASSQPGYPAQQPYPQYGQQSAGQPYPQPSAPEPAPQWQQVPDGQQPYPQPSANGAVPVQGASNPDFKAQMAKYGIGNPVPALAVAGLSYVAGVVMAILVLVLAVVGLAIMGSDSSSLESPLGGPTTSDDGSGFFALVGLLFQFVGMGAFGSLGLSGADEYGFSIRFVPFAVTAAMAIFAYIGGRFIARRSRTRSAAHEVVGALLGALAIAIVALIITRIFAIREGGVAMHSAGPGLFFGMLVLVGGGLYLGQRSTRPMPFWMPLCVDLLSGLKLAVVHALSFSLVMGVLAWIMGTIAEIQGGGSIASAFGLIFFVPLAAGQLIGAFSGLGSLSSLTVAGAYSGPFGSGGSGAESMSVFSMPWYVWLVTLVVGLLFLVAMSVLWANGRMIIPGSTVALVMSWIALPLAYFVGSLALMLVFSMRLGGFFILGGGAGTIGLAAWTPFLALLVGTAIEVLSRYVAPYLLPMVPAALVNWFRNPQRAAAAMGAAARAAAERAQKRAAGSPGQASAAPQQPSQSSPQQQPGQAYPQEQNPRQPYPQQQHPGQPCPQQHPGQPYPQQHPGQASADYAAAGGPVYPTQPAPGQPSGASAPPFSSAPPQSAPEPPRPGAPSGSEPLQP